MEKFPAPILGTLDQIARMQALLSESDYGDLGMWNDLCAKHVRLIREHGFESFKRTINFEYHQWAVRSLVDVKSLKLVAALLRSARLPHAAVKARMNVAEALDTEWTKGGVTKQGLRAYRAYVGLLWDFASSEDELGLLRRFDEPIFGRPLPIHLGEKLISQDLALSALEINSIARQCDLRGIRRVAEIGAGYGRVAWLFLKAHDRAAYHVFDIPPALAVSQNYLGQVLGRDRSVARWDDGRPRGEPDAPGTAYFHLPLHMDEVIDGHFDLVINISSFDEMPKREVEKYFAWIDRKLKGALYLKGYRYNPASGWSYKSFPYRPEWRRVWSRVDPTNPLFVEQVFRVNS